MPSMLGHGCFICIQSNETRTAFFIPWRYDSVYADVAIPTFPYDSELQSYCALTYCSIYSSDWILPQGTANVC